MTARTIRGDIAELCELGIQIDSIAGRGYSISKTDKNELLSLADIQQEYVMPITPSSRQEHILKELILNPKGIQIDAVLKQLYISKSTLDRDIANIKNELQEHGLHLNRKTGDIVFIGGDELLIRRMYMEFFEDGINAHCMDKAISNDNVNSIFTEVKGIVSSTINQENIELSGDEYDAVVALLMVIVFRNMNGYSLNSFDEGYSKSNKVINTIIDSIELGCKLKTK